MTTPYYNTNPGSLSGKWTNNVIAMKNVSGSTEALASALRAVGMQNSETMKQVMIASNMIKIAVGGIQVIRGVMAILKHKEAIENIKANILTAEKSLEGPSGWALIASATAMSIAVGGGLLAVQSIHKDSFDINDKFQRDINAKELGGIISGS